MGKNLFLLSTPRLGFLLLSRLATASDGYLHFFVC